MPVDSFRNGPFARRSGGNVIHRGDIDPMKLVNFADLG